MRILHVLGERGTAEAARLAILLAVAFVFSAPCWAQSKLFNDVRDFGAKCDGTADDHIAIQKAINTAYASSSPYVQLPSGTCYIGTGDPALIISRSVTIVGNGFFGPNGSYLKYGGTGITLKINNGSSTCCIYAVTLKDFGIQSTGGADQGIQAIWLSEGLFDHVLVGGVSTSHFNSGIYFENSGDIEIEHPVISYNNVGVWFDSAISKPGLVNSQITIHDGSLYDHSEAAFKVNACAGCIITGNWIESYRYGVEANDSGANYFGDPQLAANSHLVIQRNRFLANDRPGGTFQTRNPLYLNGTAGKLFTQENIIFDENDVFTAAVNSPDVAYPVQMNLDSGTNALSFAWVNLARNTFHGQTKGVYEVNNPKIQVSVGENRQISKTGDVLISETDSTTANNINSTCIKSWNGAFLVGCNNAIGGYTSAVYDGSTAGATRQLIRAGASQGAAPLWQLQDNNGNPLSGFSNKGELFLKNGISQTPFVKSGFSSNTDLAGRLVVSNGSGTYTLTGTYSSAPNCVCADVAVPQNSCSVSESATVLKFAGTGTDMVKWVCVGRN